MELKLYDTLTREKQVFSPLDPANVRMYVCGPTVYDFAHIGNARPVIVFDVLFRLLRHLYGEKHVTYVRNITDVDDKINARAAEEYPNLPLNEAIRQVTEKTDKQFHEDVAALGCLPPTVEPRATEHIDEMKELIERIIEHKRAYVLDDHVLFQVKRLASYGKLSHRSLEDMRSTARGEVAPKRDPMDFVLWKPSKSGEPAWPSPAKIKAPGRPGWHIECSAMSWKYLGERFDIHGGGIDLLFPHHENERAQSCRAFNRLKMAQVWMHNGFLQVEGEKMAKSLGNFVTIRELLRGWKGRAWPGAAIRWAMLQKNYREPIDWTLDLLTRSVIEMQEFLNLLRGYHRDPQSGRVNFESIHSAVGKDTPSGEVINALCDDLNTSEAVTAIRAMKGGGSKERIVQATRDLIFLGILKPSDIRYYSMFHGVQSDVKDREQALQLATDYQFARSNGDILFASSIMSDMNKMGLQILENEPSSIVISTGLEKQDFEEVVRAQITLRNAARERKDWEESDRIRDELAKMGVVLKDTKDGTTWEIAR
ncbi:MAG: cysteine--tRNA ligase [Beijerinckiaceae bacterium]